MRLPGFLKKGDALHSSPRVHFHISDLIKIVVLDDNISIREVVKTRLGRRLKKEKKFFEIFSADNGVEGLGYIFAIDPKIAIIDTTLPKYSGKEVLDFLISNPKSADFKVILIHQGDTLYRASELQAGGKKRKLRKDVFLKVPDGITLLDKRDDDFLDKLEEEVLKVIHGHEVVNVQNDTWRDRVEETLFRNANKDDRLMYMREKKGWKAGILLIWPWLVVQVLESVLFTLFRLFVGHVEEGSIERKRKDAWKYRVRVYPSMVVFLSALSIALIKLTIIVITAITSYLMI